MHKDFFKNWDLFEYNILFIPLFSGFIIVALCSKQCYILSVLDSELLVN